MKKYLRFPVGYYLAVLFIILFTIFMHFMSFSGGGFIYAARETPFSFFYWLWFITDHFAPTLIGSLILYGPPLALYFIWWRKANWAAFIVATEYLVVAWFLCWSYALGNGIAETLKDDPQILHSLPYWLKVAVSLPALH